MWKKYCLALALAGLSGCGTTLSNEMYKKVAPTTAGEQESGYAYIPVDPFPVKTIPGEGCGMEVENDSGHLLNSLPDNAVRMLVERLDSSGSVSYGVFKSGAKGESYRVTVDYINADTINVPVWIAKSMVDTQSGEYEPVSLFTRPTSNFVVGSEIYEVTREEPKNKSGFPIYSEFNIPVYIGVGLRVSANVYVVGANANISGIGLIGAEAEAEKLKGSLVVQTLGVNGKSVTAALPIQSELNRTTAQNAIVAVGSIKALLYADETIKSPRVVGFYLPFPGGKPLINALISELSKRRVEWKRPCLMIPAKSSR